MRAAEADIITLSDLNSTFSVDAHSQAGAFSWQVDGTEHLFKQWYWYRVGSLSPERSIDTLTFLSHTASDTDADGGLDRLVIKYSNPSFTLDVEYNLTGGPAGGTSTLAETITVTNVSTRALGFHLFEYTDFNLGGTAGGDTATRLTPTTIRQTDGYVRADVNILGPAPNRYEIALVPTTINKLNDGSPTLLSNTSPTVGPGDVASAYQWDPTIQAGQKFILQKQKVLVPIPEPTSLLLIGTGVAGLAWRRRRAAMTRDKERTSS